MSRSHLLRIAISFAVVLTTYWAYALFAVPWIEPQSGRRRANDPSLLGRAGSEAVVSPQRASWEHLFPEGAWERADPKVLESGQITLLFTDYHTLDDGRMELKPCTIIFHPRTNSRRQSRGGQRPTALQAPAGAILEFDEPLDLRRIKVGRLVGGQMPGPIKIFNKESRPGAGDELYIETRNVMLSTSRIFTPHQVDFRYGSSFGSGQDLNLELAPPRGTAGSSRPTTGFGGVKSVELVHVDRVHLQSSSGGLLDSQPDDPKTSEEPRDDAPMEITCQGPFVFNLVDMVASFEDQVDVVRINPEGEGDQLSCRLLEIYFNDFRDRNENRSEDKPAPQEDSSALPARKIVAQGHPVILRSPSRDLEVRGQRFEYDLKARRFKLDGGDKVMLRHGDKDLECVRFVYQSAQPGRLGKLWAAGPGRFRGVVSDSEPKQLEAAWQHEMRIEPQGNEHVIQLEQRARLSIAGTGTVSAERIYCWLSEVPPKPDNDGSSERGFDLRPNRMRAESGASDGEVQIDSPRLTGQTNRLDLWFVHSPHRAPPVVGAGSPVHRDPLETIAAPRSAAGRRGLRNRAAASMAPAAGRKEPDGGRRFHVSGKHVGIKIRQRGNSQEPEEITVRGDVYLSEAPSANAGQQALVVMGSVLEVQAATSPDAAVHVSGSPATVRARGLTMTGGTIQLQRGSNRLWINGPGWMTVPVSRDLDGGHLPTSTSLGVSWKGHMDFDGSRIDFRNAVVVQREGQQITSDSLQVDLSRGVDFRNTKSADEAEVKRIHFDSNVATQNRVVDSGRLTAVDTTWVRDLTIDLDSGHMHATGPGWVNSVRHGSTEQFGEFGAVVSGRPPASPRTGLNYLHVDFQKGMDGNVYTRRMDFSNHVAVTFGPVDDWNSKLEMDGPEGLGEHGIHLTCDTLTVIDGEKEQEGHKEVKLNAQGNARVEGQTFTARAHRLSYESGKDLLILEGSGRSKAELWHTQQERESSSKLEARKIFYRPRTKWIDFHDVGFVGLVRPPAP